jgi:hypothetical protein
MLIALDAKSCVTNTVFAAATVTNGPVCKYPEEFEESNVNILDYSSIQTTQPPQRESKPKASFSLNRTNGAAVDLN